MVKYQVVFRPRAVRDFDKLDQMVADRLLKKLRWLAENLDSIRPETLSGPLSGLFKLRVGDYRVIYEVSHDKGVVTVRLVGHRREIYDLPA